MVAGMAHALAVEELTVEFPGVRALDGVTVAFDPHTVHGVIGENGAGKSTLMRVLAGLQKPTGGRLRIDGEPATLRNAADAERRGIAMIHQELNLVGELSVAENLTLGREPTRFGLIDRLRRDAEARRLLGLAGGGDLEPNRRVGTLSVAQQQTVEIAKALGKDARVVIMDEPTAVLGGREADALLSLVRRLRDEGRTVVYISHRLAEVRRVCDRVMVLRDGRLVAELSREEIERAGEDGLAARMVGRDLGDLAGTFPPRGQPQQMIGFEHAGGGVDVAVRRGEIFGLAGLVGAGRTEWAESVVGLRPRVGRATVNGEPLLSNTVAGAMRAGVCYVSEDRKAAGLELDMSIAANTTLATLRRYCHPPVGLIDRKGELSVTRAHARNLRTKFARATDPVSSLSGGNQQKVALARWLDARPAVLILDEPTRGVDVGAKREIYRVIADLAAKGMACVVVSSELPELLGLCHRVGVMRGGRVVATLDAAEATEERVMQAAAA